MLGKTSLVAVADAKSFEGRFVLWEVARKAVCWRTERGRGVPGGQVAVFPQTLPAARPFGSTFDRPL